MAGNDDLNKKVTEAIQAQLVMLMPEEDIRTRVDTVLADFFAPQRERHSDKLTPSKFDMLVHEHIKTEASKIVAAVFTSPDWRVSVSENGEMVIGQVLQKAMGVAPNVFRDSLSKAIATGYAMDIVQVLNRTLMTMGHHQAASQFYNDAVQQLNSRD